MTELQTTHVKVFLRRDKPYIFLPEFVIESLKIRAGELLTAYLVDDKIIMEE
jgi:hypothetical protein